MLVIAAIFKSLDNPVALFLSDGVEEVVTNLNSPTKRNVKVSLHSAPQLDSPLTWVLLSKEPSLAVLVSWQCLCRSCKLSFLLEPPFLDLLQKYFVV